MSERAFFAASALLPDGWARDVTLTVGDDGLLVEVEPGTSPAGARRLLGPIVPGMPNLHGHAFQRALAGGAEARSPGSSDDFWTWRRAMYASLDWLGPDELQAIAAFLYAECLEGGFTAVGEFHYVHRDPDGRAYADPAELALRIRAAAQDAGVALTLLPVVYQQGGLGQPPAPGQRRFVLDDDAVVDLVERLLDETRPDPSVVVGLAPHSLRAVALERIPALVAALDQRAPGAPVHIHASEQTAEVDAVVAATGMRPIEALAQRVGLDGRWCLVHATHADAAERAAVRAAGAVVGLCPSTEASLGDGLFAAVEHITAGGAMGIGTDSHVCRDAFEELRLLEVGQRLLHQRRVVCLPPGESHVGAGLWRAAARGGARALGQAAGALAPGRRADFVELRAEHPDLVGRSGDVLLDAAVFSAGRAAVDAVWVGGERRVERGRHVERDRLERGFVQALRRLRA